MITQPLFNSLLEHCNENRQPKSRRMRVSLWVGVRKRRPICPNEWPYRIKASSQKRVNRASAAWQQHSSDTSHPTVSKVYLFSVGADCAEPIVLVTFRAHTCLQTCCYFESIWFVYVFRCAQACVCVCVCVSSCLCIRVAHLAPHQLSVDVLPKEAASDVRLATECRFVV